MSFNLQASKGAVLLATFVVSAWRVARHQTGSLALLIDFSSIFGPLERFRQC